jgi:DNA invertase Pin-like site-specific DNA recombinase
LSVREPWTDVEGPARELLAAVMAWVSGFERQRLIERVHAGLERARRQGKALGRPRTSIVLLRAAAELVEGGTPVAAAARAKGVSRASLYRYLSENPVAATPGKAPALAG